MSANKPRRLRDGAHIRVLSLASPAAASWPRRFERACTTVRSLGYRVSEGTQTRARLWPHMAGPPALRARDFVDAWNDPDVDAILSVTGGYSTHQILEYIDFGALGPDSKPLIGYSDTTSLLMALYRERGFRTFYGPSLMPQFGEVGGPRDLALSSFRRAVAGDAERYTLEEACERIDEILFWDREDTRPRVAIPAATRRALRPGRARGPFVAANMGCLLLLAGTRYFPCLDGAVLILEEDEEEKPQTIDRYLTQLRHLGVFERIAGLALGRLPSKVGLDDALLDEMVLRATAGTSIPILVGVEVGHVDPAHTIPIGAVGELDAEARTLHVCEAPTAP